MANALGPAIVRVMNRIDRVLIAVAQCLLVAMVLLAFTSVCARIFLNQSVPDDILISELLMVAIVFLPLGYVQSVGAHLEVTVLTDHLSLKIQSMLKSLGLLLGISIFGLMAYVGWLNAYEDYQSGAYGWSSTLYIPIWPAKMMIPLGLAWWCLRMLAQLTIPAAREHEMETELSQALAEDENFSDGRPVWSGKK